jgi:outer membrane protein
VELAYVRKSRFENDSSIQGVTPNPMKLKFVSAIAVAILLAVLAFSQAGTSSAALPAAPGAADPAATAPALNPNASKVVAINVEQAIFATNEGQREMGVLQKKFEPKFADLKAKGDEIDALKKKLTAAGTTEPEKADINRQIESKQKAFDRARQDAQEDAQGQQGEIGQRIFQKMGPVIMKVAQDNGYGMIVDTSTPWPQGPILWANPASMDITKTVVDAYNAQSGVAAPTTPTTRMPGGTTRPTAPGTKPSTMAPSGTKPSTTTPPGK